MMITGTICEIGDLDDEDGARGIVISRGDGTFVTIKGLTEDEARALAPNFMDQVDLTVLASEVPA